MKKPNSKTPEGHTYKKQRNKSSLYSNCKEGKTPKMKKYKDSELSRVS